MPDEQLGQQVAEPRRRLDEPAHHAVRLVDEAVAHRARRRRSRCRAARRCRSGTRSGCSRPSSFDSVRTPQPLNIASDSSVRGDERRLLLVDDAGPQAVAHVRADAVDAALVAVETEREVAAVAVVDPEVLVEAALQLVGARAQRSRELVVAGLGRAVRRARRARRTRSPAPRTARSASRASVPSAKRIESQESFQPWFCSPWSVVRWYST